VHGVRGFDNAHKAAAEQSETDFFISIDGDNRIDPVFLLQTLDWNKTNPGWVGDPLDVLVKKDNNPSQYFDLDYNYSNGKISGF
jgi:cellulose synthase/poly-beta-1,6-N-acetylglucosamine synthase-like glycosyltransferase